MSESYKAPWNVALSTCHIFGMELLSLESESEESYFLNLCHQNSAKFDTFSHIGAVTNKAHSRNDWWWVNSGKKLVFNPAFPPGEPNNNGGHERCLSLYKQPHGFMYNDMVCYRDWIMTFVCQEHEVLDNAIALTTPRNWNGKKW